MSLIGHVVTVLLLLPCQGLLFNNVDISDDKIDRQSFTFYLFPFAKVNNIGLNQGCELKCFLSVMLFSPLVLVQWLMYSPLLHRCLV